MAFPREIYGPHRPRRKTALPVTEVTTVTAITPDHIYVIAPGRTMTVRDGALRPVSDSEPLALRSSIDAFFLSLAEQCGGRT